VISIYAWDRHADLAVLKVDGTRRSFLPLALANDVKQGTEVIAMGHPFGLEQSVVEGVISAEREVDGVSMLQLAMAVEPGNSGGPVVDRAGQVVGIVNAKAALTRNLGFATSVKLLSHLLAQPNATTLERWMHFNSLDTNEWTEVFGAAWHWHSGQIEVENPGHSFGGRALLLRREMPHRVPYELEVEVRLEDESGAAGLVFDSDGVGKHYGFYPTGGRIRVTAFGGPEVGSWQILQTLTSEAYLPGEWNRLRVRVLADGFEGYVNDQRVFAARERVFGNGLAGLAKFRDTKANFRSFSLRPLDAAELAGASFTAQSHNLASPAREWLQTNTAADRSDLLRQAADFERLAAEYRRAADRSHQSKVIAALRQELDQPEEKIGLFRAALLLAQFDQPALAIAPYERQLQQLVSDARKQLADTDTAPQKLTKIRHFLFEESGFHGNRFDYYDLANCHLNSVLDEREGIPVTLCVLYLELCWQLGIKEVEGLPLPGHFMVRFRPAGEKGRVVDVFRQGAELSFDEADQLVAAEMEREPHSATVKAASKRDIILRIAGNLRQFSQKRSGMRESLPYLDLLVELSESEREGAANRIDRAGLLVETGDRIRARLDLQWIVDHRPEGVDIERVEAALRQLSEAE
jgi:regulator of sirC expression with transglutaminase-like and TPR domain